MITLLVVCGILMVAARLLSIPFQILVGKLSLSNQDRVYNALCVLGVLWLAITLGSVLALIGTLYKGGIV